MRDTNELNESEKQVWWPRIPNERTIRRTRPLRPEIVRIDRKRLQERDSEFSVAAISSKELGLRK